MQAHSARNAPDGRRYSAMVPEYSLIMELSHKVAPEPGNRNFDIDRVAEYGNRKLFFTFSSRGPSHARVLLTEYRLQRILKLVLYCTLYCIVLYIIV